MGILGEFFVFLPNVLLIAFDGTSVPGGWSVEGVALVSYSVIVVRRG